MDVEDEAEAERRAPSHGVHTIDVGFGALTGSPFAFTGARVPAASAFLCSRWICVWL
jgi:hypothetical protein